jgi:hypothetical protein
MSTRVNRKFFLRVVDRGTSWSGEGLKWSPCSRGVVPADCGANLTIQVLMGTIVRDGDVMRLGSHCVQVKTGGEVGLWRCGADLRRRSVEEVVHCDV